MNKKLVVNHKWCKGCGICVAFCPKNVLEMKNDKIYITDESKCIFCGQCELRCPDYAIYVEEKAGESANGNGSVKNESGAVRNESGAVTTVKGCPADGKKADGKKADGKKTEETNERG